jgi:hypothetical protein
MPWTNSQGAITHGLIVVPREKPDPTMPTTSRARPSRATPLAPILRANWEVPLPMKNAGARAKKSHPGSRALYPSTLARKTNGTKSRPNSPSAATRMALFVGSEAANAE